MTIYESGIGDTLLHPESYNFNIKTYLQEEANLVRKAVRYFDCIVELGCSDARHLPVAREHGKYYIGVDNVARYIDKAREDYAADIPSSALLVCSDINSFDTYVHLGHGKKLFVFPFNIIGNIADTPAMLEKTFMHSHGVIVFTYKNDFHTQSVRSDYYNSAGFENITCITNRDGVRFTSKNGLNTIAWSEEWFREQFSENYQPCHSINIGNIGVAYMNFGI